MEKANYYSKLEEIVGVVVNEEYPELSVTVSESTKLLEEYPIDSIFGLHILSLIEEEFGIIIDDEDLSLDLLSDMEQLRVYIETRMNWPNEAGKTFW